MEKLNQIYFVYIFRISLWFLKAIDLIYLSAEREENIDFNFIRSVNPKDLNVIFQFVLATLYYK